MLKLVLKKSEVVCYLLFLAAREIENGEDFLVRKKEGIVVLG
jgi:hypothetical protein